MKKIAAIIAMTVVASSANAFVTTVGGTIDSNSGKSSFAPTAISAGTASGTWEVTLDTAGAIVNGGTLKLTYSAGVGGYGGSTNTYTNMVYNLTAATSYLVDSNYNGTGTWLSRFDFGYTIDNTVSWGTNKAPSAPSVVKNTNGSYVGNVKGNNPDGQNGTVEYVSGSHVCAGSDATACSIWTPAALGIEGVSIYINVNQNAGFAVLGGSIRIQEVAGATGTYQGTTVGSLNPNYVPAPTVPVPAAAWLMGSGLVGLAGIARRRKMA